MGVQRPLGCHNLWRDSHPFSLQRVAWNSVESVVQIILCVKAVRRDHYIPHRGGNPPPGFVLGVGALVVVGLWLCLGLAVLSVRHRDWVWVTVPGVVAAAIPVAAY